MHRALAGQTVTRFETVLPKLSRVDYDTPLAGRTVESVEARGKWLLMHFSGDLILLTHMLMSGSWHIYRPGETWQRHRSHMRIVIETPAMLAVAFNVPVAEFHTAASLARREGFNRLGPAPLCARFRREPPPSPTSPRAPDLELGLALLDQTALAGLGNVFKSEVAFACGLNPFRKVATLTPDQLASLVDDRAKIPADANVTETSGHMRTTGRTDLEEFLWVYGRAGEPCRRCATPIRPANIPPTAGSASGARFASRRAGIAHWLLPVYDRTMSVDSKQLDSGVAVVTISGRLAMGGETERLDATVKGLLQKDQKQFVLDITALDYADSSGIGMLVSCLTNVKKAGGELKLAAPIRASGASSP